MAYDDIKDPLLGSPKLSEIVADREGEMTGASIGETALTVIERMNRTQSDALKRMGSVLYSEGDICWDGTTILSPDKSLTPLPPTADSGADMQLRFTQTSDIADFSGHEDPADQALIPVSRTIDLIITAADLNDNAGGLFTLLENQILYIAITYDDINGSAGVGFPIDLVAGGYLQKVTPAGDAVGMPSLENKLDGNETTLYIPLAMRVPDWNDGVDPVDKQDLLWLVNGTTRWPAGTCAPLGSLITDLNKSLPSTFVTTEGEFDAALVTYSAGTGGGIICIDQPITLTGIKNIDEDIHIYGRSSSIDSDNTSLLTFQGAATLTMGDRSRLWNLGMDDTGLGHTAAFIETVGDDVVIEKCQILTDAAVSTIEVNAGVDVRIRDCTISGVVGSTGIEWSGALGGTARDVTFVGLGTDNAYVTPTDVDLKGSYTDNEVYRALQAIPPIGSIIPILQGYHNALQTIFTDDSASTVLSDNYHPCDGSAPNDVNSPIWNDPARHVPQLTDDRFLMGDIAANEGTIGGANIHSGVTDNGTVVWNTDLDGDYTDIEHTHEFNHTHIWKALDEHGTIGETDEAWYTFRSAAEAETSGLVPETPNQAAGNFVTGTVNGDTFVGAGYGSSGLLNFGDTPQGLGVEQALHTSWPYIDNGGDTQDSTTDAMNDAVFGANNAGSSHRHQLLADELNHTDDGGNGKQDYHTHTITDLDNIPQYLAVRYYIRIK